MQEIEIKFLNIDPIELEKKLLKAGAEKLSDEMHEEWIFKKSEWAEFHGRVRIRATGDQIEISYKETVRNSSEGNTEIEFDASNKEQIVEFIDKLGIPLVRHQQKRRIHYVINNVSVDIDFWPLIPPLVEIEGENIKDIEAIAVKLDFSLQDVCNLDARQIIKNIYHVDIDALTEYTFDNSLD